MAAIANNLLNQYQLGKYDQARDGLDKFHMAVENVKTALN